MMNIGILTPRIQRPYGCAEGEMVHHTFTSSGHLAIGHVRSKSIVATACIIRQSTLSEPVYK
jgi:hypothetical protein